MNKKQKGNILFQVCLKDLNTSVSLEFVVFNKVAYPRDKKRKLIIIIIGKVKIRIKGLEYELKNGKRYVLMAYSKKISSPMSKEIMKKVQNLSLYKDKLFLNISIDFVFLSTE